MEINAALRQTVAPSGAARPTPPPDATRRSGPPANAGPPQSLSREAVIALAAEANAQAPGSARLRVDESTDRIVLEVLNSQNEVVKQIPPEALLKALAKSRQITGLILDQKT